MRAGGHRLLLKSIRPPMLLFAGSLQCSDLLKTATGQFSPFQLGPPIKGYTLNHSLSHGMRMHVSTKAVLEAQGSRSMREVEAGRISC